MYVKCRKREVYRLRYRRTADLFRTGFTE